MRVRVEGACTKSFETLPFKSKADISGLFLEFEMCVLYDMES